MINPSPMGVLSMVDERGYCTDCDSSDCLHARLYDALSQVEFWKRKATERVVEARKVTRVSPDPDRRCHTCSKTLPPLKEWSTPYCPACTDAILNSQDGRINELEAKLVVSVRLRLHAAERFEEAEDRIRHLESSLEIIRDGNKGTSLEQFCITALALHKILPDQDAAGEKNNG